MSETPFEELDYDEEVRELKEKRGLNAFYQAMQMEFYTHSAKQKKLPRRVQKIHYLVPIPFLPKRLWRIDTSRGFTRIRVDGEEQKVAPFRKDGKECLYLAELDIRTNKIGAIETVEYVSYLQRGLLLRNMKTARRAGDIIKYHQTTTMTHLRSIYMGLFEPFGATKLTADGIIMMLMQALRDGSIEFSYQDFGYDGYLRYDIDSINGETFSALFDFRNLYNSVLGNEQ